MKRDVLVAVGLIVGRRGPYTTMTTGLPTKVQSTMNPEVVLNVLEVVNRGIGTASEYRIPTVLPKTYSKILFPVSVFHLWPKLQRTLQCGFSAIAEHLVGLIMVLIY